MEYQDLPRLEALRKKNADAPDWVNADLYRLFFQAPLYRLARMRLDARRDGHKRFGKGQAVVFNVAGNDAEIDDLIRQMREERFQFASNRQANVVAQAIRVILECIYGSPQGPVFDDASRANRPHRRAHAAFASIRDEWSGVNWFVDGRIDRLFDTMDRDVLFGLLRKRIRDERFLNLIRKSLQGADFSGGLHEMLTNVYLHEFDTFITTLRSRHDQVGEFRFVRYADRWLFGVHGPKSAARELVEKTSEFLQTQLRLAVHAGAGIQHAVSKGTTFLGVRVVIRDENQYRSKRRVVFKAPLQSLVSALHCQGFCDSNGKPTAKKAWTVLHDARIVQGHSAVLWSLLRRYSFVDNYSRLQRIQYILHAAAAKTLAAKHNTKTSKIFQKHGKRLVVQPQNGKRKTIRFQLETDWRLRPNRYMSYDDIFGFVFGAGDR